MKDRKDVFKKKLSKKNKIIIENLCRFIKNSRVLQHADFSNTGMTEKILWYFGRTMRRTRSLRALHLSDNPGITPRLLQYL
jgi:hypothetical protein